MTKRKKIAELIWRMNVVMDPLDYLFCTRGEHASFCNRGRIRQIQWSGRGNLPNSNPKNFMTGPRISLILFHCNQFGRKTEFLHLKMKEYLNVVDCGFIVWLSEGGKIWKIDKEGEPVVLHHKNTWIQFVNFWKFWIIFEMVIFWSKNVTMWPLPVTIL